MHAPVKEAGANPHAEAENQEFFLLSDVLPEDRILRQGLQEKRLVIFVSFYFRSWFLLMHVRCDTFSIMEYSCDNSLFCYRQLKEWILKQQKFERDDTNFKRGCLICRTELTGTRANYLKHLSEAHNIQLGRTDNLVFVDELVDHIEQYLNK